MGFLRDFAGSLVGGAAGFFLGGPAGAVAGAKLGGGYDANRANRRAAELQMQFQANQAGTAHQRAVADLVAAGLNPMLAYHGGAQAMPGAMPHYGNVMEGVGEAFSATASGMRTRAETMPHEHLLKKLISEWELNISLSEKNKREADRTYHLIRRVIMENEQLEKYLPVTSKADAEIIVATAKRMNIEGEIDDTMYGAILRYVDRSLDLLKALGTGAAVGGVAGYMMRGRASGVGLRNRGSAFGLRREPGGSSSYGVRDLNVIHKE